MADSNVVAALLHEREMLAHRDNFVVASALGLVSVGALVVGALILNLPELCPSTTVPSGSRCISREQQGLFLLVPLPSVALAAIVTFLATISNPASQMLHKIEGALWRELKYTLPPDKERGETLPLPLPSSSTLWSLLLSPRPAKATRLYRASMRLLTVVMAAVLIVPVLTALRSIDGSFQITAALIYGPVVLVLLATFIRVNMPHRRALRDAASAAEELGVLKEALPGEQHSGKDTAQVEPSRRRHDYRVHRAAMFVPRPQELLLKSWVIVGGLLLGRAISHGFDSISWPEVQGAILVLIAFELALYQGRYMINDIRDRGVDAIRAFSLERGRNPGLSMGERLWGVGVRLGAWVSISLVLGGHTGKMLLSYGLAVLAAMLVYDNFSDFAKNLTIAHPSEAPTWIACVRVLLGAPGYAIRFLAGLSIGSGISLSTGSLLLLGSFLFAAEGANIALGWVLEASAEVDYRRARPSLARRPHVAALGARAGIVAPQLEVTELEHGEGRAREKVLLGNPHAAGLKIWNVWGALSIAGAVPAGLTLANGLHAPRTNFLLLGSLAGVLSGGLLLLPATPTRPRLARLLDHVALPSGLLAAAGAALLAIWAGSAPGWAILPAIFASLLYEGTRVADYESYARLPSTAASLVRRFVLYVLTLLLGRRAAAELMPPHRAQ